MKYIMIDITDEEDYDIQEEIVFSTLKAAQNVMSEYMKCEEVYPKFLIQEASFVNGVLCATSILNIYTRYEKRNGIKVPIMEVGI